MRKTLSKVCNQSLIDNATNENDLNLSNQQASTSPKADLMWRAVRILKEEGKNFTVGDIFALCDDGVSIDYAKKFVVSLYFRDVITRISRGVGKKPAVYNLEKDEKPDPLFVPPYVYRKLMGSKAAEMGLKESEAEAVEKSYRKLTGPESAEAVKKSQPEPPASAKSPEKPDISGDTPKPDAATAIADKSTTSKPDKTATKHNADDMKMAQYILRGYHEDLASKVQRLNLYVHGIYEDRKMSNIREGLLLVDLIGECIKLYFTKTAQVETEEITLQKLAEIYRPELSNEDKAGWQNFVKDENEKKQSLRRQAGEEE